MVVGQPLQEATPRSTSVGGHRRGRAASRRSLDDVAHLLRASGPSPRRLADVAQHALQVVRDRLDVLVVADPADLDVHPRLALGARRSAARRLAVGARDASRGCRRRRGSRRTAGGSTRWTSRCCRVSSITTESTRNGMSSVTTSTTVCPPADQPCSARVGVNTWTRAVPCGRTRPGGSARPARRTAPPRSGRDVLDGHVPVVGAEERSDVLLGRVRRCRSCARRERWPGPADGTSRGPSTGRSSLTQPEGRTPLARGQTRARSVVRRTRRAPVARPRHRPDQRWRQRRRTRRRRRGSPPATPVPADGVRRSATGHDVRMKRVTTP